MKKLSLFLLALLAFGPMVWAQDWIEVSDANGLNNAITNGTYIRLTADITLSAHLTIPAEKTITINLGGHILQRNLSSATNLGCVIIVAETGNLTLTGGTVSGGWNSGYYDDIHIHSAGGIVNKGSTTLNNVTITNCKGIDGGAIMNVSGATLNITGDTISNCQSTAHGGGAIVNYGTTTISGCIFSGNTAKTRGGAIWSNSNLTVSGCTFNGNNALAEGGDEHNEGDGGAIHVENGTAELSNVTITNNTSKDAGGIFVNSGASLTITGTNTFSDNQSTQHGGGAIVSKGTTAISGCTISGNTCKTSGGAIYNNGSLTVSNCTISGNTATNNDGGALHLETGTATLIDVALSNNTSKDAGGIFVNSGTTLNLGGTTGSTLSGNTSSQHGGGGIVNQGTTKLTGKVNITGNTCKTDGNGIWSNGTLEMEGNIRVKGNNFDDIFLKEDKKITITGALTGGAESIGIRMETPKVFTVDYQSHNTVTNHFFSSGTINTLGLIEGEGKMYYAYYEASWNETTKQVEYTINSVTEGQTVTNVCKLVSPDHGGYLNGDTQWFVVDGSLSLIESVSSVTCSGTNVHLILCDGSNFKTGGLYVNEGTTLHIYCQSFENKMGKLTSSNSTNCKPGIGGETDQMGSIIIHGGDITASGGSNAAGIGGRLNRPGKNITIYGGKIKAIGGEEGAGIGGGCGGSGEYITIYGGTITANGGKFGAGIGGGNRYNGGGNCNYLNIYGGTITANGGGSAAGIGSGLWVGAGENDKSEVRVTIHGGTINATGGSPVGSTSSGSSENLYLGGAGIGGGERGVITDITINGGIITANAVNDGAGIGGGGNANQDGTITINGGEIHATGGPASNSSYTASKNGGAGIGGGCHIIDFNTGAGGQVVITGGTIYAEGGTGADGNGAAIGHGGGSSTNGTLELPNNYSVKAGNSPTTATLMTAANRASGCRQFYALVEPCIHDGASFTDNGNGVTFSSCSHCATGNGTEPYTFKTFGNWNDNTNWFGSIMPGEGKDVKVTAAAIIPNNYLAHVGNITIQEGGSLTISNGGQLIHSNAGVTATVEKNIAGHEPTDLNGWYFIASPMVTDITPSEGNGFLTNEYDLYYYHEPTSKWRNYKSGISNQDPGFQIEPQQGYLYANEGGTTLNMTGTLRPSNESVTINNLSYTSTAAPLSGWNLVGNPFACNATINKPCYTISGTAINTTANGANVYQIAPCEAVMVQADATNESVTFTRVEPASQASHPNNGNMQIMLTQANTRSAEQIDNAIVSFNEGEQLGKFYFGEQNSNIYIPQDGKEYAIVSVGGDVARYVSTEIPVNFKANQNGQYTISVNPEGVEMGYLHLIDNMTGADVDLLATSSYTFTAKTTDYESRFKLVFAVKDGPSTGSGTFAFISDGNIIVNGEGVLQVVDVMGRIIISTNFARNVSTSGMTPGVYVLRLIDENDVRTQKIVIK